MLFDSLTIKRFEILFGTLIVLGGGCFETLREGAYVENVTKSHQSNFDFGVVSRVIDYNKLDLGKKILGMHGLNWIADIQMKNGESVTVRDK